MKDEIKIKHLEFTQGIISRFSNNSFLIKGWTLTISLAGFGFYLSQHHPMILLLTLFGAISFWHLDSYYLRQEKLFRELYSKVASNNVIAPFTMATSKYEKNIPSVIRIMFSYPTVIFYAPILLAAIVLSFYALLQNCYLPVL